MKSALITGILGQDAAYLSKLLIEKNYHIFGGAKCLKEIDRNDFGLNSLNIKNHIKFVNFDLSNQETINQFFKQNQVDEVYNLASLSDVSFSFKKPTDVFEVNTLGVTRILESVMKYSKNTKFFQASSSEVFGRSNSNLCNENSIMNPVNPYGLSKYSSLKVTKFFRDTYRIYACSGILFNHESPLRTVNFITRKITENVSKISKGLIDSFEVGNIFAQKDWGHASDYVEAMWLMLQKEIPEDYVIGTGQLHSVKEIIELCFDYVKIPLEWKGEGLEMCAINKNNGKKVVTINSRFYRPIETGPNCADITNAKTNLNWKPKTNFKDMINEMMYYDLKNIK